MVDICVGDKIKLKPHCFSYRKFRDSYHEVKAIRTIGSKTFYDLILTDGSTNEPSNCQCEDVHISDVEKSDPIKVGDFIVPPKHFQHYPEAKTGKLEVLFIDENKVFLHMPVSGVNISFTAKPCLVTDGRFLEKVENNQDSSKIKVGDKVHVKQEEFFINGITLCKLLHEVAFVNDEYCYIKLSTLHGGYWVREISEDTSVYHVSLSSVSKENVILDKSEDLKVGDSVSLTDEAKLMIDQQKIYLSPDLRERVKKTNFRIVTIACDSTCELVADDESLQRNIFLNSRYLTKETSMSKKQKYDVGDSVFVENDIAEKHLPAKYLAGHRSESFYEFKITHKKANTGASDYLLSMPESDGGVFQSHVGKTGYWMREELLLSRKEKEEKEKSGPKVTDSKSENKEMNGTDMTNMTDMTSYKKQMSEIRTFNVILTPTVEFGKTCIRYAVHLALSAIGKSNKFISAAFTMLDDFIEENSSIADNAIRWILGFLAKNINLIRKIPVIGEWKMLEFLEREDIQKFGIYAQASTEGKVLGDFITKILGWVKEWIFGSAVTGRISDAIKSEEGLLRFVSGLDANMKKGLAEKLRVENESEHEAQAEAELTEQKVAAATPSE